MNIINISFSELPPALKNIRISPSKLPPALSKHPSALKLFLSALLKLLSAFSKSSSAFSKHPSAFRKRPSALQTVHTLPGIETRTPIHPVSAPLPRKPQQPPPPPEIPETAPSPSRKANPVWRIRPSTPLPEPPPATTPISPGTTPNNTPLGNKSPIHLPPPAVAYIAERKSNRSAQTATAPFRHAEEKHLPSRTGILHIETGRNIRGGSADDIRSGRFLRKSLLPLPGSFTGSEKTARPKLFKKSTSPFPSGSEYLTTSSDRTTSISTRFSSFSLGNYWLLHKKTACNKPA